MFFLILLCALGDNPRLFLEKLKERLEELGNPWVCGMTEVGRLSWEEKKKLVGVLPIKERIEQNVIYPNLKLKFPDKFDWRNKDGKDWMTYVKYQGSCGSCWAFTWVGVHEACINIASGFPDPELNLSEQRVLSCSGYGSCNGGMYSTGLGNWVARNGLPWEWCCPYIATRDSVVTPSCDTIYHDTLPGCYPLSSPKSRPFKILRWGTVVNDPSAYKNALQNKGPLMIALDSKMLEESIFFYKGGTYIPVGLGRKLDLDHAVVLCGWDDEKNRWIIKNSWGWSWGEEGYGYFPYGYEGVYFGDVAWVEAPPTSNIILLEDTLRKDEDGIWELGEELELGVKLYALRKDFNNVELKVEVEKEGIIISNSPWKISTLTKGDSLSNIWDNAFRFKALSGYPSQRVNFTLTVTADTGDKYTRIYEERVCFLGLIEDFFLSKVPFPYGIDYDSKRNCLWVTEYEANYIYKVDPYSHQVIDSLREPNDGRDTVTGLTYDGESDFIWIHNFSQKRIQGINLSSGEVEKEFHSPAGEYPTGVAFDGEHLWVVDRNLNKMWRISKNDGSKLKEFTIPVRYTPTQGRGLGGRGLCYEEQGDNGRGSLLLVVTHFDTLGEEIDRAPGLDSTRIYEITLDGTLIEKHTNDPIVYNARTIAKVPSSLRKDREVEYWTAGPPGWIARIKGYYEYGVEERVEKGGGIKLKILENPSVNEVKLKLISSKKEKLHLSIYDVTGRKVESLVHEGVGERVYVVGRELAGGVYFLRVRSGREILKVEKIVLLK